MVGITTRLCLPHGDLISDTDESIHFEKHKFVLDIDPFVIEYYLNDSLICSINSLGLLSIERQRKENLPYESDTTSFSEVGADLFTEKVWKEMLEPIPNGPEAISIDIGFPNFNHIFGIPERINSFKLKSTVEYSKASEEEKTLTVTKEEEPFRLFTCDHFNDKYPNHS